jgi:hypothetical protein
MNAEERTTWNHSFALLADHFHPNPEAAERLCCTDGGALLEMICLISMRLGLN